MSAVDTQVLTAVEAVYSIQRGIEEGTTDLIHAIDGAALDVEAIVGQTIFADYPFLLKRIVNVSQLHNSEFSRHTYLLFSLDNVQERQERGDINRDEAARPADRDDGEQEPNEEELEPDSSELNLHARVA